MQNWKSYNPGTTGTLGSSSSYYNPSNLFSIYGNKDHDYDYDEHEDQESSPVGSGNWDDKISAETSPTSANVQKEVPVPRISIYDPSSPIEINHGRNKAGVKGGDRDIEELLELPTLDAILEAEQKTSAGSRKLMSTMKRRSRLLSGNVPVAKE
ncbi:hypothetical protein HDU76_004084, partial [Blyttiomyces sp. JEL0837]